MREIHTIPVSLSLLLSPDAARVTLACRMTLASEMAPFLVVEEQAQPFAVARDKNEQHSLSEGKLAADVIRQPRLRQLLGLMKFLLLLSM